MRDKIFKHGRQRGAAAFAPTGLYAGGEQQWAAPADFADINWTPNALAVTGGQEAPPGAPGSGWVFRATAGDDTHCLIQHANLGLAVPTTQIMFAKAGTVDFLCFGYDDANFWGWNLTTGEVEDSSGDISNASTAYGNGWWYLSVGFESSGGLDAWQFSIGDTAPNCEIGTSWTAAGTETVHIYSSG